MVAENAKVLSTDKTVNFRAFVRKKYISGWGVEELHRFHGRKTHTNFES